MIDFFVIQEVNEVNSKVTPDDVTQTYDYLSGEGWVMDFHITGSVYICDPPVLETDLDYVVRVLDIKSVKQVLQADGWKVGGSKIGKDFTAFRKGKVNLICTQNEEFYKNYIIATQSCKKLNLLDKQDRIKLFDAIIYKKF